MSATLGEEMAVSLQSVGAITLFVEDSQRSKSFYERVFGLPYFGQLYVLAVLQKQVAVVVVATTVFASVLVLVGLVRVGLGRHVGIVRRVQQRVARL